MGGISGLSVWADGGIFGISGTKDCAESGSVFFVMMEAVVREGCECVDVCLFVCLSGFQSEPTTECAGKPLSGLTVQLLCEKTEVLKHFTSWDAADIRVGQ